MKISQLLNEGRQQAPPTNRRPTLYSAPNPATFPSQRNPDGEPLGSQKSRFAQFQRLPGVKTNDIFKHLPNNDPVPGSPSVTFNSSSLLLQGTTLENPNAFISNPLPFSTFHQSEDCIVQSRLTWHERPLISNPQTEHSGKRLQTSSYERAAVKHRETKLQGHQEPSTVHQSLFQSQERQTQKPILPRRPPIIDPSARVFDPSTHRAQQKQQESPTVAINSASPHRTLVPTTAKGPKVDKPIEVPSCRQRKGGPKTKDMVQSVPTLQMSQRPTPVLAYDRQSVTAAIKENLEPARTSVPARIHSSIVFDATLPQQNGKTEVLITNILQSILGKFLQSYKYAANPDEPDVARLNLCRRSIWVDLEKPLQAVAALRQIIEVLPDLEELERKEASTKVETRLETMSDSKKYLCQYQVLSDDLEMPDADDEMAPEEYGQFGAYAQQTSKHPQQQQPFITAQPVTPAAKEVVVIDSSSDDDFDPAEKEYWRRKRSKKTPIETLIGTGGYDSEGSEQGKKETGSYKSGGTNPPIEHNPEEAGTKRKRKAGRKPGVPNKPKFDPKELARWSKQKINPISPKLLALVEQQKKLDAQASPATQSRPSLLKEELKKDMPKFNIGADLSAYPNEISKERPKSGIHPNSPVLSSAKNDAGSEKQSGTNSEDEDEDSEPEKQLRATTGSKTLPGGKDRPVSPTNVIYKIVSGTEKKNEAKMEMETTSTVVRALMAPSHPNSAKEELGSERQSRETKEWNDESGVGSQSRASSEKGGYSPGEETKAGEEDDTQQSETPVFANEPSSLPSVSKEPTLRDVEVKETPQPGDDSDTSPFDSKSQIDRPPSSRPPPTELLEPAKVPSPARENSPANEPSSVREPSPVGRPVLRRSARGTQPRSSATNKKATKSTPVGRRSLRKG